MLIWFYSIPLTTVTCTSEKSANPFGLHWEDFCVQFVYYLFTEIDIYVALASFTNFHREVWLRRHNDMIMIEQHLGIEKQIEFDGDWTQYFSSNFLEWVNFLLRTLCIIFSHQRPAMCFSLKRSVDIDMGGLHCRVIFF
ncbi:hypothetical protein RCL_jg25772.t1 [Rhizophagus clarus]|uniref:Uncharacterized protein n=1 Tax=Rhizophagus clarus TaxID=94130 RepID=A0A8H3LNK8_9GLOM|nr:hypothetical protein RCL_jg25772.t1 [Rhizophagus clarus]